MSTPRLPVNVAPVTEEINVVDLPVTGTLPKELSGRYLRNGPNPRRPTDHWFAGDGMVHGVRLLDGKASWYRNRFVRTESFDTPMPVYQFDGSRNLHSSVANTNVVQHAGKILALVETSLPYEISAELDTVGCHDFGGRLEDSMTAHPKTCPKTGELHFFGYGNLREPYVTYHRANAAGDLVVEQSVDVPGLTMMHDFAMTESFVIFLDLPVVFDLQQARTGASMPYCWDGNYGARVGLMRRAEPAALIRWFEIDPCYIFHVANAYERNGTVVIQAVKYSYLWRDGYSDTKAMMWEWIVDPAHDSVQERQIDDRACEFPRIDDRLTGLASKVVYTATDNALLRYNTSEATCVSHEMGQDQPGEAVFVPKAGSANEYEGYLLSYVFRPATHTSDLVVLDAARIAAPPVAIVHLPRRVPSGFHGNWFAD